MIEFEQIPVVIYEHTPELIHLKEETSEGPQGLPFELRPFFSIFSESIISPSVKDAVFELKKKNLMVDPHFFYIFAERESFLNESVISIRRDPLTSLSPIFVNMTPFGETLEIVDGVFRGFSDSMINRSREIWEVLNKLNPNPYAVTLPENWRINYLRFLLSREKDEERPFLSRDSVYGFTWPVAYYILRTKEKGRELDDLELLENQGLVSSEEVNKTSLCPACSYYNLIFREVCPACGSIRIRLVEFIHHYSCGYIGPVEEFIKGEKLFCPKCHETLKHIGVDYDKPLEKYICADCKTRFLEPEVDVLCANCKKKWAPEEVISSFIKKFMITPLGKTVAVEGKLPINIFEELSVSLGVINFSAFMYILEKFMRINNRYPERQFCVVAILFRIKDEVLAEIPLKIRTFLKDLVRIIKDNSRESDIISTSEEKFIFILLPETPPEGGSSVKERLSQKVERLLKKNKLSDFVRFVVSLRCVPFHIKASTAQEVINSLIKELEQS
ncbi:TackOD1 domain-containing metal-binding protein [Desulfurobacterium crinifex]